MNSSHLHQLESHSMCIKPFMSEVRSSPQRSFSFQPLGIAKPVETVKRIGNTVSQSVAGTMQEKGTEKSFDCSKDDDTSGQLSTLHVKLYAEAERIRKWKIATEMDIEQKEQKLRDSQQLMESQRKSLLELQLENENLSLRLSEEIENKQEIMQKVTATRELCYAARSHMDNLEKRICSCEETRIMVDEMNAKRMTEVEVLLKKFEDLSNQHEEKINMLNNAVKIEKMEKETLKSNFTSQLNCSAEELRKLHEALKVKELHNTELQQEIDSCNANMSALLQKQDEITEKLNESENHCNDMQKLMEELGERKLYLEESIVKQQEALQELQLANDELTAKGLLFENAQKQILQQEAEINDLKKEHATKIKILNKKLKMKTKVNTRSQDKLQSLLDTTAKENEALLSKIASLQQELSKARTEWETEKEEVKNNHKFEMKEILDLLDKTEGNYQNTISTKEAEIQELKKEITMLSDEMKCERKKLEEMEKQWEEEKSSLKELHSSQMKDVFDILDKADKSYQKTILAKEDEAENLRKEIANYSNHLRSEENKEVEISSLRYEKDNLQEMMETMKKTSEKEISKLKSENDKLQIEVEKLQQDKETAIRLHNEKCQLQTELDILRKECEKLTVKSQSEPKEEIKNMAFDTLLQDTTNVTHCTVKRQPLVTAEVQPKPRKDYKSYSRSSPYISQPERNKPKRTLTPITEVKPLQEKFSLDPKPKQRKFFKYSRAIKKQIKNTGLLWFDIEEED